MTTTEQGRQCHTCNETYADDPEKRQRKLDQARNCNLLREYGITLAQYRAMAEEQQHVCKLCGEQETRTRNGVIVGLVVDHDHDTGRVRGLLCSNCNVGIGYLKHNTELLRKAIAYLTE